MDWHLCEISESILTESIIASVDNTAPLLVLANRGNSKVILYGPLTRQLSPKLTAVEKGEAVAVRMKDWLVIGVLSLQEYGENGVNIDITVSVASCHCTEVWNEITIINDKNLTPKVDKNMKA